MSPLFFVLSSAGGAEAQADRLRREGFAIEPGKSRRPPKIKEFEKWLVRT